MEPKRKHTLKAWFFATRPWAFPASAMPIVVTCAYLFWIRGDVNWYIGLWAMLSVLLFHAAANCWSDYKDFIKGVDREDTIGGVAITSGEFQPSEIKWLAVSLLVIAMVSGLALMFVAGWHVLWMAIAGCVLTLLYPWFKYHALGDVDIFLTYSLLPILGTSYVATGEFCFETMWLALPVGLITVGILHANNIRDMEQDKRAGIKTLVLLSGRKVSVFMYSLYMLLPFLWVAVLALSGVFPLWSLLVFLALKLAVDNVRGVMKSAKNGAEAMNGADERTAQLQLLFSLLFAFSFLLAALL